MRIELDRSGTPDGFACVLHSVAADPNVSAILVLACDDNGHTPANTDPVLRSIAKPLIGGVFPQIIFGLERLSRGTIVLGLTESLDVHLVRNLSDPAADLNLAIESAIDLQKPDPVAFVIVDGFARRISGLVDALFQTYGLEINYLGGGAGSLSFVQKPCVLTNEGILQDVAIIAQASVRSGIGVAHGWNVVSDPIQVTDADRNIIISLNHQPAFDVYREIVQRRSGRELGNDNFFDVAKFHPFGIRKMGSEMVVRDPITVAPNGSLACVGEVPKGSFVCVLEGKPETLIAAARDANTIASQALDDTSGVRLRIFVDCISRALFLQDGFTAELEAVDDGCPMIGALTLGEIANSGRDYLEFYNKTAVVGLFLPR